MKNHRLVLILSFLLLALAVGASAAPASTGNLKILTPADHAQLDAGESYPLEYAVVLGPGDDHFHVWVDGERSPGIHDLKGTYRLPKLTPGEHVITLKLVDKGHVPTGPQTSIQVHVK
ncbi:MAG TPA: hypothetical protein VFE33_17775 [Thermoanaerobaculia bacterium]|nr:hypothetical protein [Thermoanaerobaculia bacterium]